MPFFQRNECAVLCDCDASHPVQPGALEYYCRTCRNNAYEELEPDHFVCLVDQTHQLTQSGKCLNKAPRCGHQSAAGECLMLADVRRRLDNEVCPLCRDPEDPFLTVWDCGHVMCCACFMDHVPRQKLFAKNRQGHWTPSCLQCTAIAPQAAAEEEEAAPPRDAQGAAVQGTQRGPGSTHLTTFKLLNRDQYEEIKDRGAELSLAEEQDSIVCSACNSINDRFHDRQHFNCLSCGLSMCVLCRLPRAGCMHASAAGPLADNFRRFFEEQMWMPCPRCRVGALKDTSCNHVTCSACSLKFCYACGRAQFAADAPGTHRPSCTSHPNVSWLSRILADEITEWHAKSWEHVFFPTRAFVVVTTFMRKLTIEQARTLRTLPCPVVSMIENVGMNFESRFEIGTGTDLELRLSCLGWDAFLGANRTAERLETTARRYFGEWFDDVARD